MFYTPFYTPQTTPPSTLWFYFTRPVHFVLSAWLPWGYGVVTTQVDKSSAVHDLIDIHKNKGKKPAYLWAHKHASNTKYRGSKWTNDFWEHKLIEEINEDIAGVRFQYNVKDPTITHNRSISLLVHSWSVSKVCT